MGITWITSRKTFSISSFWIWTCWCLCKSFSWTWMGNVPPCLCLGNCRGQSAEISTEDRATCGGLLAVRNPWLLMTLHGWRWQLPRCFWRSPTTAGRISGRCWETRCGLLATCVMWAGSQAIKFFFFFSSFVVAPRWGEWRLPLDVIWCHGHSWV